MSDDHLTRGTGDGVRVFAAITTRLVEEARIRHGCSPVATAALGRLMTGAVLLAANLKTSESVTIKIDGGGQLGECLADATADGSVRGYVKNPHVVLPLKNNKLDVGTAVGTNGSIYVTRFTGLKQPFTGSIQLVSGEIAEDITNYLYKSEQIPSSVALGVLVNTDTTVAAAGGFFIQALPQAEDEVLTIIEKNISALPPVSTLVHNGCSARDIIEQILAGLTINIYDNTPLMFKCTCNRKRVEQILISLGKQELTKLIDDGKAEVSCQFCNEKYNFTKEELKNLLHEINIK